MTSCWLHGAEVVPDDFDCSNVWVFGYGSLIFNPVIEHTERVNAKIYGNHRRFCLRTRIGRGSPDCPGLVLALDRGGSCAGVAFKLNPETAIAELDLLWRREMITLAYNARWVKLHTDTGRENRDRFCLNPGPPELCPTHVTA